MIINAGIKGCKGKTIKGFGCGTDATLRNRLPLINDAEMRFTIWIDGKTIEDATVGEVKGKRILWDDDVYNDDQYNKEVKTNNFYATSFDGVYRGWATYANADEYFAYGVCPNICPPGGESWILRLSHNAATGKYYAKLDIMCSPTAPCRDWVREITKEDADSVIAGITKG